MQLANEWGALGRHQAAALQGWRTQTAPAPPAPAPRRHAVGKQRLERRVVHAPVAAQQRAGSAQTGHGGARHQGVGQHAARHGTHGGAGAQDAVTAVAVCQPAGGQRRDHLHHAINALDDAHGAVAGGQQEEQRRQDVARAHRGAAELQEGPPEGQLHRGGGGGRRRSAVGGRPDEAQAQQLASTACRVPRLAFTL